MKKIILVLAVFGLLAGVGGTGVVRAAGQDLVPKPVSVEHGEGVVVLVSYPAVETADGALTPIARYLMEYLPAGRVRLALEPSMGLPAEGYLLEVAPEGVSITGVDYGGVWNGVQTLLQLMPQEVYCGAAGVARAGSVGAAGGMGLAGSAGVVLPEVRIEDYPRMAYRGVMLDVARTFVPKEDVMRLVDNIARHKINKLHLHLADDEGWRVEIKSYPRLHSVGGFRGGFAGDQTPLKAVYGAWDERYGGFYTQDDIREMVAWAAVRNVEIIPEIDLPGHSRAAGAAYPEIRCDYTPNLAVSAGYDVRNVWCAAREENFEMLEGIIGELAGLFPSETIHLGGDEVETGQWSRCPRCRALMAARGMSDAARLEDVFMERVIEIAARHGKKAGVWNEAAASGVIPRSVTVWGWENISAAFRVTRAGYPVVMCPGEYFYFDQRQGPRDRGHTWAGVVSLEKVYSFEPGVGVSAASRAATGSGARDGVSAESGASAAGNVVGVEATFFSELLLENGPDFLDYQLFPRVCALAEVAWTPAGERSWDDFARRLRDTHLGRLGAMGIKYRAAAGVAAGAGGSSAGVRERTEATGVHGAPRKTPAVRFTGSMPENAKYPFAGVASYERAVRISHAPVEGDRFVWEFAAPVVADRVEIKTGYDHLQRAGFPLGRVEVSYDGRTFERAAEFHDLKASFVPERPFRAVRIVCEAHGNGENFTIVQPLKIY